MLNISLAIGGITGFCILSKRALFFLQHVTKTFCYVLNLLGIPKTPFFTFNGTRVKYEQKILQWYNVKLFTKAFFSPQHTMTKVTPRA